MKTLASFILVLFFAHYCAAQTESYDLVTYTPGATWKKLLTNDHLSYSTVDKKTKTWLQIAIYKNVPSKGNADNNFASEWNDLVTRLYNIALPPNVASGQLDNGFQSRTGTGSFIFENAKASAQLVTFTGNNVSFSILINTNSNAYAQAITSFLQSVKINAAVQLPASNANTNSTNLVAIAANKTSYTFSTSRFDDGWVSTIQQDWVEITKGPLKVLLHFPTDNINYSTTVAEVVNAAWKQYAAQRYSNLRNLVTASPTNDYEGISFGGGEAVDKSGNSKYVALFRRAGTWWMEIIEPDKAAFIRDFGFDPATVSFKTDAAVFAPFKKFANYNRFAVAATDLSGEWKDHYSSNTFYVNTYTGANAGMSTYTSSSLFRFGANNSYHHDLIAVNFSGGSSQAAQTKSDGTFSMLGNWKLQLSDMEGKPATYDVYFSAIKGGRILFMNDADHPGSGMFKGFSKTK